MTHEIASQLERTNHGQVTCTCGRQFSYSSLEHAWDAHASHVLIEDARTALNGKATSAQDS